MIRVSQFTLSPSPSLINCQIGHVCESSAVLFEDTEIKSQSLTNSLTERASDKVTYWAVLDSKKGEKEGGANGEHQNDEEGGVLHMMMFDESWEWKCKELVLSSSLTPMLNSWSRRPSSYCTLSSMFIHLSSLFLILYIVDQRGMGTFFAKIKILSPKWKLREHFTEKENIWS